MAEEISFQAAMREAAAAAWDQGWERAVEAYSKAVRLAPTDSQALTGLALSLFEVGRFSEALQVYERVARLVPNDPLPHERIAAIYERLGRRQDAARKYLAVGELYNARRDIRRAVPNWEHAARLNPDLQQPHVRLAAYYEQEPQNHDRGVYAYLHAARLLQQAGDTPRAEQALLRAQSLSPINADVRDALATLKSGGRLERVDSVKYPPRDENQSKPLVITPEEAEDVEEPLSALEETARAAMGELADLAFSGEIPEAAQESLIAALQYHQVGDLEAALSAYGAARKAGFVHPAVTFNMGVLYSYAGRHDQAVPLLTQLQQHPQFKLVVYLLLGRASMERGQIEQACQQLIDALQGADQTLNQAQVDLGGYQRLREGIAAQPPEQQLELARALSFFLGEPSWRTRLQDTLDGYASRDKISYVTDLIEMIIEGGRPEIAEIMQRVDTYIMRNNFMMAKEETHSVVEYAPDYLPAHVRMADILIKEGRMREAATKINLVATAYQMRGNADKAADLFARVIEIWPADMAARSRVIEMLKDQGRAVEALRQYLDMGDVYHRMMADPDKAVETYLEALEYARVSQTNAQHIVPFFKALADIEMQRLNYQRALAHYVRVAELAPDDSESAVAAINLYFQLGETARAVTALDSHLRYLLTHGNTRRVVSLLEQQVRSHPDEIALRQRLADVYLQQKRHPEAIGQLDALGELYLDAGRFEEAKTVLRKLVSLDPPDVDGYRRLLEQLDTSA